MEDSVSPGDPIFDVVQQTLGHQRVLVEVHQMRRLTKTDQARNVQLTNEHTSATR